MIDQFQMINNFEFPKNLVLKLLTTYDELGKTALIQSQIGSFYEKFVDQTIITDTLEIIKILKEDGFLVNLSDQKIKLLLAKPPQNLSVSQKMVVGIKKALQKIRHDSHNHYLNSSDLLEYLNLIFNQKVHFNQGKLYDNYLSKTDQKSSIRHTFDLVLEKVDTCYKNREFEKIMLSLIGYCELLMLKPYKIDNIKDYDVNKIAGILLLIYYHNYFHINCFDLSSFVKCLKANKSRWQEALHQATYNYPDTYLKINDLTMVYLDLIDEACLENFKIGSEHEDAKDLSKINAVERSIIFLPKVFTKDDIRKNNPYASDSTIMRALKELSDDEVIMPLSKGRNASWMKCGKEEDYLKYLR